MLDDKFWDKGYLLPSEREGYLKLDPLDDEYLKDIIHMFRNKEVWDLMEYLSERHRLESGVSPFNAISEYDFYVYIRYRFSNEIAHERTAYFINDIQD